MLRIKEYIVSEISAFRRPFCNVLFT